MPSVATWWCGQDEPRQEVLDSLDRVVIKPAFPRFGQHAEFPATMTTEARDELAARLNARPDQFVAQEQVAIGALLVRRSELQVITGREYDSLAPLHDRPNLNPPQPADINTWVRAAEDNSYAVQIARAFKA